MYLSEHHLLNWASETCCLLHGISKFLLPTSTAIKLLQLLLILVVAILPVTTVCITHYFKDGPEGPFSDLLRSGSLLNLGNRGQGREGHTLRIWVSETAAETSSWTHLRLKLDLSVCLRSVWWRVVSSWVESSTAPYFMELCSQHFMLHPGFILT